MNLNYRLLTLAFKLRIAGIGVYRIGATQRHICAMALDARAGFDYAYANTRLRLTRLKSPR
jgi:hypothetical protein